MKKIVSAFCIGFTLLSLSCGDPSEKHGKATGEEHNQNTGTGTDGTGAGTNDSTSGPVKGEGGPPADQEKAKDQAYPD